MPSFIPVGAVQKPSDLTCSGTWLRSVRHQDPDTSFAAYYYSMSTSQDTYILRKYGYENIT